MPPRRIHITGGPGSGKTTAARRLGALLGVPVHDLDGRLLAVAATLSKPVDLALCRELLREEMAGLAAEDAWISEGAYLDWAQPFFERAELIVWLRIPWRVASYRILARHVKATIRHNNRFPGWRKLYRFWRWSRRYYSDRNRHGVNEYGTPNTVSILTEFLEDHQGRVVRCRGWRDVVQLLQQHDLDEAIS
jgi:adenylate kinase family enzyme